MNSFYRIYPFVITPVVANATSTPLRGFLTLDNLGAPQYHEKIIALSSSIN